MYIRTLIHTCMLQRYIHSLHPLVSMLPTTVSCAFSHLSSSHLFISHFASHQAVQSINQIFVWWVSQSVSQSMDWLSVQQVRYLVKLFLKVAEVSNSIKGLLITVCLFQKDDIHGLLKNLQQSTRSLQHFCSHSKVSK